MKMESRTWHSTSLDGALEGNPVTAARKPSDSISIQKKFYADFLREISMVGDQWFFLGANLEVPHVKLKYWKKQNDNSTKCVLDLFIWLMDNTHPCWELLIEALCKMKRYEQAQRICQEQDLKIAVTVPANQTLLAKAEIASKESRNEIAKVAKQVEENNTLIRNVQAELLESKKLMSEKEHLREQLESMKNDTEHLVSSKRQLQEQLELSERNYVSSKQRLTSLVKELEAGTTELETKSLEMIKTDQTDVEEETKVKASRKWDDDFYQMELARKGSQKKYITEIKSQVESEKHHLILLKENIGSYERTLNKHKIKLASVAFQKQHLQQKQTDCENIEQQVEITRLNIQLVELRSDLILERNKLKATLCEKKLREDSLRRKINLIPDLRRCVVKGLTRPLHSITTPNATIQFVVRLYSSHGVQCQGHHIVEVHENKEESDNYQVELRDTGVYAIHFYPTENCFISIFVNGKMLIKCVEIQVPNQPHIPNCSVLYSDKVGKFAIASVTTYLRDEICGPVIVEQKLTATLTLNDTDNMVISSISLTGEGEYTIVYMPGSAGDCKLKVCVNGQAIGEPRRVVVTAHNGFSTPLIGAASCGHVHFIEQLARERGLDVNRHNTSKWTPLMVAARSGHLAAVVKLLHHGALVNSQGKFNRSALYIAARRGHVDIMNALIASEAEVNCQDNNGRTPLMVAVEGGHFEAVKSLVTNGASLHLVNKDSQTALDLAQKCQHTEIYQYLFLAQ